MHSDWYCLDVKPNQEWAKQLRDTNCKYRKNILVAYTCICVYLEQNLSNFTCP
jgi:hypothetical protein